jgi:hypothetical protein
MNVTRLVLLTLAVLFTEHSASAQPPDWSYGARREGVHLRILRDYHLAAGTTAQEPIVVIGGSATIDGRVEDDVVVVGGTVRIGPTAVIRGDVVSVGGETLVDPAAQVSGRIDETVIIGPDFDIGIGPFFRGAWWPVLAFGATLLRLGIILVIATLLTIIVPGWIQGISLRAAASPLAAAGIGLAGEILFIPTVVVVTVALMVSIIGFLLLLAFPFVMGAAALLWVAGVAAVAVNLGATLRGRRAGTSPPRVLDLLVGFLVITSLTLLAQALTMSPGWLGPGVWGVRAAGWVIEWMAWTIGLGAALAALLGGRLPVRPPAMPFATPAATQS